MRNFLFIILCAAAGFMAGCTDNTNSVGNNLIGDSEKFIIADTTIAATGDTVFNVVRPNGFGQYCVVGRTNDVEAKTWLRFIHGVLNDSLRTVTIDTVEMRLTVGYTWNAPATPARFEIRESLSPWTQAGVTSDSLASLQIGTTPVGVITDTLWVGRQISVQLDTAAARRWITQGLDAAAAPKFEFVLAAAPGAVTGMFGYLTATISSTSMPSLLIRFHKNGVRDSIYTTSSEDTFMATTTAPAPPGLEVRGGVSTWSKITFDAGAVIPPSSIINNAVLELTQNSALTQLGVGSPDTLYAFIARKGTDPRTIDSTYRIIGKRKDNTSSVDPVYVFTVTPYVQFLINPGTPYDGIVLQAGMNIATVDHMSFYSSKNADASKRPRLLIAASKK